MSWRNIVGEVMTSVFNPIECLVKNNFCDIVVPKAGSVVRCDLLGGIVASHTGICVGQNEIVEIQENDGWAYVHIASLTDFLTSSIVRTGRYLYVASAPSADGRMVALGSSDIAQRAREAIGSRRGKYFTLCNNCHQFTRYCVEGIDRDESTPWGVEDVVEALKDKFGVRNVVWRSTGLSKKSGAIFAQGGQDE